MPTSSLSRSIPKPMIEAGESFGATRWQLLWKVELPAALPSIMAGLTQCIMLSLSMVVFATLIGAPSLGNPVNKALANPAVRARYEKLGAEPVSSTLESFGQLWVAEEKKWTQVIRTAGIRSE